MAVLITGGAGFIGSHTCVELMQRGENIVLLDNYANSDPLTPTLIRKIVGRDFSSYHADMRDEALLCEIFEREDIESVVHFASLKAVGESVEEPLLYYENNIGGTLCLLKVMERYGCRSIVFSSSATVYGETDIIPFVEGAPTSATNPYGWCKVMIERMLTDICRADERWSAILLRYFNPIGAHSSALIGENPLGIPNNLVPYIMKVASGELPYLEVFGDDYPTPDGTGVRDYIHVCDLAEGHVDALIYARAHRGAEEINLGSGLGYSVLDVLHACERAVGNSIPYVISQRRAGDVPEMLASVNKAKELLGWATHRSLDDMCESSWRYYSAAK